MIQTATLALVCVIASSAVATAQQQKGTGRVVITTAAFEGTIRIAGVEVELHSLAESLVLAKTVTDSVGVATFPDVPPGRYVVKAARPGFVPSDSPPFEVKVGEVSEILLDIPLTFVAPDVEVRAPVAPAQIAQPVSTSDMLSGSVIDIAPLQGDDFQSLLPLMPGVVRGPDGRLRPKGGQPTSGALQISSASLIDPSSGDFDVQLPGASVESVELLANPFAAEYGRFSTSVVQIRTRRGTNQWEFQPGNLMPRFRKAMTRIRAFEPRMSVRGPLVKDRVFLAQDFQFRYVSEPIKSLPDEPTMDLTSFDSFTRVDGVVSTRHFLGGLLVMFPRNVDKLTMDTFRPPEVTPDFEQHGYSIGVRDRFALTPTLVFESTLAARTFEIELLGKSTGPMTFAPASLSGSYFNDQERDVRSLQWVQSLSISRNEWQGEHLFKVGIDIQQSSFDGQNISRPVEIRRDDGSLAERITFGEPSEQSVSALEVALFAQDRWRVNSRLTLEYGIRMDREDVVNRVSWSPRVGAALSVLAEGRGILRGGFGRFRQRTPLNVGAFQQFEPRVVARFDELGFPVGPPVAYTHVTTPDLHTPEANAGNIEWDQRFGRRVLLKANVLIRNGSHEYLLQPDPASAALVLSSSGTSKYRELELTMRYLGGERRDFTISYVRSKGTADLNNYDQFFGNVRNPIVRENEHGLIPTDVPHRLLVRGTFGLFGDWTLAPVLEIRSGFPWSAVNEYQDFVGERNRAGRLPVVKSLDLAFSRPWRIWKYRFNAGIRVYNIFGSGGQRDVQNNIASPAYGQFFNPLERSIGFVFGVAR
jgi:hypothetical protein